MDKEDEIQALRRELELLRAQVDGQRGGGGDGGDLKGGGARQDSPVKPLGGSFRVGKPPQPPSPRDPSPRRNTNGATAAVAFARGVSFYEERGQRQSRSLESEYINHVPVDTKRGKWWLKDRQVLSRNVPAPDAEFMAIKVRETWLWSGRTVVVDKIVTVPTSRVFDEQEASRQSECDINAHRSSEFDRSTNTGERPQQRSSITPEVYAESKQLAKEFMLPSPSKSVGDDGKAGLTASARMEAEMARAMVSTNSSEESSTLLADAAPQTPGERFK